MIKNNKLFIFIILFFILIMFIPTFSIASDDNPITNPGYYEPGSLGGTTQIVSKANVILGAITVVGVIISAITLIILGIKYMVGSVEEKAEYKKSMIPYIIGVILLISTSTIVGIIAKITQETL